MAKIVDWKAANLKGYLACGGQQDTGDTLVCIECTCATGFEEACELEVKDVLGLEHVVKHQGRVFFDIRLCQLRTVLQLRTVDNIWVLMGVWPEFHFATETATDEQSSQLNLHKLNQVLLAEMNWHKGLMAWNEAFRFFSNEGDLQQEIQRGLDLSTTGDAQNAKKIRLDGPSFRCTCYRTGRHNFSSMDVAKSVGGAIQDQFGWTVKMKQFDIEVVVIIDQSQVYASLSLTKQSLHNRNISHFGPTTLRATICAAMLRLADIQPGDVVLDPMCGGASIPLEGALTNRQAMFIAGDLHEKAVDRAKNNLLLQHERRLPADLFHFDATRIPLRSQSVDVLITDLPFGKRSGSKADNRVLYPQLLLSMAKVVRPSTGRAVLLTQDKNSMFKNFGKVSPFWKNCRQLTCNIGGLTAIVFLLRRTLDTPA